MYIIDEVYEYIIWKSQITDVNMYSEDILYKYIEEIYDIGI